MRKTTLLGAVAALALHGPAHAQQAEIVFDPLDDLNPVTQFIGLDEASGTAGTGIEPGVRSEVAVAGLANSNLFAESTDATADVALDISPEVRLRRSTPTLRLDGRVSGRARLYAGHATENVYTADGELGVRWQATPDLALRAAAHAGHLVEDRAAAFAPLDVRRPVQYQRFGGSIGAVYTPGRLVFAPFGSIERLAFQDNRLRSDPAVVSDQSRRSFVRVVPGMILGVRADNGTEIYVGAEWDWRDYDERPARNSEGYAVYGGLRLNPNRVLSLTAELGYQEQNYDPPLSSPSGLLVRVKLQYVIDPLSRLSAAYRRDIAEPGTLDVGGAGRERLDLSYDRTLTRALALGATLRAERSEAANGLQQEDRLTADLNLRYVVSPRHELFATVQPLLSRSSGGLTAANDFERVVAMLGMRLQLQ